MPMFLIEFRLKQQTCPWNLSLKRESDQILTEKHSLETISGMILNWFSMKVYSQISHK